MSKTDWESRTTPSPLMPFNSFPAIGNSRQIFFWRRKNRAEIQARWDRRKLDRAIARPAVDPQPRKTKRL